MDNLPWIRWPLAVLSGPLIAIRRRPWITILALLLVAVLTLVTQIGGAVLWLSWPLLRHVADRLKGRSRSLAAVAATTTFLVVYGAVSVVALPPLAAAFGREPLPCFSDDDRPLQAVSPLYCLTNRNYARTRVHQLLHALSSALAREAPGTVTAYLDAGFPFFDGFPMLPHLSHRGGRDVDLAFFYRRSDDGSAVSAAGAWPVGYWAYVQPRAGDPNPCAARIVDLRWDMDWLQPAFDGSALDERRTGAMLRWLAAKGPRYGLQKVLLEPHLQRRLSAEGGLFRFQGCGAARHDDHLHLQIQ